jgi:hypothetical protein
VGHPYIPARYDDQGLFELARPISPPLRSAFLQAVAAALATSSAVEPGPVHRVGAELQNGSPSNCQPWPSANRNAMGGQNEAGEGVFGRVDRRSDCHPLSRVSY